jgi:type I restriction enzyme S subunit
MMNNDYLNLPIGWEIKKLGDVCQIELGKTPYREDKSFWDTEKEKENIWLSIADLLNTDGDVVSDSKEYITDKAVNISKVVKKGTLLLSFKLTLGRLAFAGKDLFTNEAIAALTIRNENEIDKYFLYHFLSFFDWDAASEGDIKVKGKTLNKAKLKEIEVYYPKSKTEQERIVTILDEAFAALAQAKNNAEQNLKNAKALFESYLQGIFENKGADWEEKPVGAVAKHSLGKMLDKNKNKGIPQKYLRNQSVRWFDFDLNDLTEMLFLESEKEKYTAIKGDVLVCEGGYPGRAAIWEADEPIYFQKAIHRVRFHQVAYNKWFVYYLYMSDASGKLKTYCSGMGIQHFTGESLHKFIVQLPPIHQVEGLVQKLDALSAETQRLATVYRQKLEDLESLKKAVLLKAFSGGFRGK